MSDPLYEAMRAYQIALENDRQAREALRLATELANEAKAELKRRWDALCAELEDEVVIDDGFGTP